MAPEITKVSKRQEEVSFINTFFTAINDEAQILSFHYSFYFPFLGGLKSQLEANSKLSGGLFRNFGYDQKKLHPIP